MDEKDIEYLQSLLKIPSVGARGVNAIYEEVKKQGKAYDNKTKSGFTLAKIKQWYESREKVQTHKRGTGYHSYTPEHPRQQFQIDLIMLPKAWRNNKNMYALVCVDIFTKKADMEPMKDKEATTCNKAMEKIFDRLGIPKTIYSDEGSEFTNNSFIQLLDKHKIEIIYATNHAPFVESFNRTMKRMMDRYMEANDISSWTTIYRDLLNAYNNTKHSATGFAPNDINKEDIDTVRKNIKKRSRVKKYEEIKEGDSVRLQLKEKTFRKESDPRYSTELHQVERNNNDGVYIVDGTPHSRKDLQLVRGTVIPSKKPTAAQIKADKVGKAAYNPVLKDLMGSRPTLEQVEQMINEPSMKKRGKQIDVLAMLNKKYRTPAKSPT
jgi:transposase InsO family protein